MARNRNKLIDLLIGNATNAVVHKILEEAIDDEVIRKYYDKELLNSLKIARDYREKINPTTGPLPEKDIEFIKNKVRMKANNELKLRISKGYKNINLDSVEGIANDILKDTNIIN